MEANLYHVTVASRFKIKFITQTPAITMNHVLRPPHIDLSAIITQQNPSIDLRVHVYEDSTRNFLKALTAYKNRAMTNISERRKHQAMEKKRLLDKTQTVEMETNQCKLKEIELVARTLFLLPLLRHVISSR